MLRGRHITTRGEWKLNPPFLSKKTNTIFYISTEEEEDEGKKHEGEEGWGREIEHKGRDLLVWWRLKKCLKKFNRAEIGASGVQNGRYVWEKYYNYFGVGGKDEWDPHWLEDFCAGVTMATASSWLTKFVGAMAVNMVIVLLIREEECAFFVQYLHQANNNNKGCCSRSVILKRILYIFHFIEIFRSLRFMLEKGFC